MKTLRSELNFLAIDEPHCNLEESSIAIVSAPYEHTVSYGGGTGHGPNAILTASSYVEFYDDETEMELCFERGIATIAPIEFGDKVDQEALDLIQLQVAELLSMGKFVVTLGGEHTISTAPIAAHYDVYPEMSILHFDAHSDLRDEYQGSKYSHASFMSRVAEFFPIERLTQVGIRAQCKEEAEFIKSKIVNTFYASALGRGLHGTPWKKAVVDTLGNDVYITFDVDGFDPAIMPSTGTPEPDGLWYNEVIEVIREVKSQGKRIVGFDVVELAPVSGVTHPDITTARLIYKMLNLEFQNR